MFSSSEKNRNKIDSGTDEDLLSVYMNSRNPVFVLNKKGVLSDVNDVFCKEVGIKSENLLGRTLSEVTFLTEESKKETRIRHVSRLLGKETPYYTLDALTKSGDIV